MDRLQYVRTNIYTYILASVLLMRPLYSKERCSYRPSPLARGRSYMTVKGSWLHYADLDGVGRAPGTFRTCCTHQASAGYTDTRLYLRPSGEILFADMADMSKLSNCILAPNRSCLSI
jgi:hypothetical protein